jgi:hypothetical protein
MRWLTELEALSDTAGQSTVRQENIRCELVTFFFSIRSGSALIAQMFVAAIALTALIVLPGAPAALVISACAMGGAWILHDSESPTSSATANAVKRSQTVIGELDHRQRGHRS